MTFARGIDLCGRVALAALAMALIGDEPMTWRQTAAVVLVIVVVFWPRAAA